MAPRHQTNVVFKVFSFISCVQVLEEKFRCTDTVVTMLQKRKEICTLDKLKQAVQEMTRR